MSHWTYFWLGFDGGMLWGIACIGLGRLIGKLIVRRRGW